MRRSKKILSVVDYRAGKVYAYDITNPGTLSVENEGLEPTLCVFWLKTRILA